MGKEAHDGEPPAARPAARGRTIRIAAALACLAAAAALAYFSWRPAEPQSPPPLPDLATLEEEPVVPAAAGNPGYLGPQACAPCHAGRVREFMATAHARACRRPADGPMPVGFEPGRGHYVTGTPGLTFDMTRAGPDYFQTGTRRTPDGERRATSRIDLAYGAHKADEVYFTWRGDRLFELMTVWLHPSGEWANAPYDPEGTRGFSREATARCLECHNTWFDHVRGTDNEYRPDSFVLGVTCERCHGPGREHVEFHQAHPNEGAPHAVVQPANLPRERLLEVCTQCHGNYVKPRGPILTYRPGEPLDQYYRLAETTYPEQDHVANQGKYLRQSKCFQKSDTLTCTTCHDPHRPHEPGTAAAGRQACMQCHKPEACGDRPNLPAAVRDDCVGCHMRREVWINVHFHTANDRYKPPIRRYQHRIAIDPVARKEVLLGWHRAQNTEADRKEADHLAGELAEHWLGEVEGRRRQYRFLAGIGAAREALRVVPPAPQRGRAKAALTDLIGVQTKLDNDWVAALRAAEEGRVPAAIDLLDRVLSVQPTFAPARNKLGTLYAATGQIDRAVPHLEAVARDDPDNASGLAMLGWLAYLGGRTDDADGFYRRAVAIEPFDPTIEYHWGLALLKAGRWPEADGRFRRALEANPNQAGALQGLAHALGRQDRPAEAVRAAWWAARRTDFSEPDVLVTLADAYTDAGRPREAAAAATKALELDRAGAHRLDFDVRLRLERMSRPAAKK